MGAEGKYDLKLVNCDNLPLLEAGCSTSNALPMSTKKFEKSNVLVNRKSSSTPSLPEATDNLNANSVASTEQAASADNLTWKQAVETIAENVLTSAKSDIVAGTEDKPNNQADVSVVVHALRELENHHDLSLINHTQNAMPTTSDLATITENYTLCSDSLKSNLASGSAFVRPPTTQHSQHQLQSDDKLTNIEANNKMNSSNSVNSISKTFLGNLRGCAGARVSQITPETLDVIDKMREGMIRNNTNNIISSEILQIPPTSHLVTAAPVKLTTTQKHQNHPNSSTDNEKHRSKLKPIHGLKQNKRQIVSVDESCSYPLMPPQAIASASSNPNASDKDKKCFGILRNTGEPFAKPSESHSSGSASSAFEKAVSAASSGIRPNSSGNQQKDNTVVIESITTPTSLIPIVVSSGMHAVTTTTVSNLSVTPQTDSANTTLDESSSSCNDVVVSNPMSISVPNLTSSSNNENTSQIVPVSPPGLLETFAALARRRTSGNSFQTNNQAINNASNINTAQQQSSFFPRGPNSVSSLVKMALSSNFHTGLLSTAQSYPSLTSTATTTSNNILNSCTGVTSTVSGQGTTINPTLTMSLTSTSSDSEQVSFEDFLDSCRGPTLLGELEDEEEMDDDNDDEENEDEYEEVGVSQIYI